MLKLMALVIVFAAATVAQGSKAESPGKLKTGGAAMTIKCTANGKPCGESNVTDIMTGLATGRRMHKPMLADIKGVALTGADGSLTCTQNNGQPCTEDQVKAVQSLAAEAKCSINYNSSKSHTITK